MTSRRAAPAAVSLAGLALVAVYVVREALAAGDRLPGTDTANLYAWEVYTRAVLGEGRLPHWNPYLFAGVPHLADPQTTVLYPPAMLLRWLEPAAFLKWMAALHLWIAGAGALFLGRTLGLPWLVAGTAAVAVAFGGSAGPWLHNGHLLLVYGTAWLPWALGLSMLSVRRRTVLPHPALPVVLVLQALAGYLQGSLYITGVVTLYFLYSVVWPEDGSRGLARWRPLAQLAILGALTLGLSAFHLLPLTQLVTEAARTAGIPYEVATRGQWTAADLTTFFWPNPVASDRAAYVGWLLVCMAPFAAFSRTHRREAVFLFAVAGGAIALAFGDNLPLYRWHYELFPGLRIPGRVLFVAKVALAILGAIGLQQLIERSELRSWPLVAGAGVVLILAAVATARAVVPSLESGAPPPVHGWPWLPFAAAAGLLGLLRMRVWFSRGAALAAVLLAVTADVAAYSTAAIETIPAEPVEALRRWLGPGDAGRVFSVCQNRVGSGGLMLAGRPTVHGLAGITLRDYVDWLNLTDATAERPSDVLGRFAIRRDLLDLANVTTVVSCEPLKARDLTLLSSVDSVFVYRNDAAWPRAVWTCDLESLNRSAVIRELRVGRYEGIGRMARKPVVNVRWAPDLRPEHRRDLEGKYRLAEGVHREGSTWRYVLNDPSASNVRGLLREPVVEDTHGVDRPTGAVVSTRQEPPESGSHASARMEHLIGMTDCDQHGEVDVLAVDQPDGRVSARVRAPVQGFIFLSEPYYPERRAFVDGVPVAALRTDLAFTAVPVPAGSHHVELRYMPRSFHLGLALGGTTLLAWVGVPAAVRKRRKARSMITRTWA